MKTVMHVILTLEVGGMEQVCADLLLHLDRRCFRPVVVCLEMLGPLADKLEEAGIPVFLLPPTLPVVGTLYPRELIKLIRREKVDLLHVHCGSWYKPAMAALWAGRRPILCTEHGRRHPDPLKTRLADRIAATVTDRVVCVSSALYDYMHQVVRIPEKKLSVILNGIDTTRFSDPGRVETEYAGRLGIVARLAPEKDIATLLQAVQLLRSQNEPVTLTVIGEGEEAAPLMRLHRMLDLGDAVVFAGFCSDIPVRLQQIDIFVLSSRTEGTSISILEAMASGLPIVATAVGGTPALVSPGINGLLVPPGDPAALAEAIRQLLRDRKLRAEMAESNRCKVEKNFSLQAMTAAYSELYQELTEHAA